MDVNIATAVTLGGGFLITQTVIAAIFGNTLSPLQYGGVLTIAIGLFCMVKRDKSTQG
jgi:multidrug transporter EmrE-like cation transporter